jgi:aspartyl-tRNA(Asn)/glutamyl-tRNA(Gln) amidotransferase subunit B
LEEDTGRLQHDEASLPGQTGGASLVDFNRAGVPLMELVTEPVITSATQAGDFARELQLLFRYLGASDADMEKGQMRVEANVSISQSSKGTRLPDGQEGQKLGVKTEIKNLNSFRSVERAIEYELARQQAVLAAGGQVVQETRGWDESRGVTYSQRQKESSHDYRYFPEPDLPKLFISQIPEFQNLAATIPELPAEKRKRLRDLGFLQEQDVEQLVSDAELAALFGEVEQILAQSKDELKIAVNLILNNVVGQKRKDPSWLPPAAALLAEIARGKQAGTLSAPQVNKAIVEKKIVAAISDDALVAIVEKVIAAHPTVVADYKAGKPAALQFLIGQAMQVSKGSANPQGLRELLLKKL